MARLFALLYVLETLIVTASPLGGGLPLTALPPLGPSRHEGAALPHVPRDVKPYLQGRAAANMPLALPAQPLPAHRLPGGYVQTAPALFHPLTTGAMEQESYEMALAWGEGWHCGY